MSMKSFIVMLSGWFILRLELILNCKALVKIVYNVVLVTENIPLICLGRCWQVPSRGAEWTWNGTVWSWIASCRRPTVVVVEGHGYRIGGEWSKVVAPRRIHPLYQHHHHCSCCCCCCGRRRRFVEWEILYSDCFECGSDGGGWIA